MYEERAAKEGRFPYNVALSDYWQGKIFSRNRAGSLRFGTHQLTGSPYF